MSKSLFKKIFTLKNTELTLIFFLTLGAFLYAFILGYVIFSLNNLSGIKLLEEYRPEIPTKIYDKNNRLISEYFIKKRILVPFEDLPKDLLDAIIVKEDRAFYKHSGINPMGILRAFLVNLSSGSIKQGGSTLTQQLAKVLFTSRKRTYFRKIKEAWLALQIERLYTKNEILEMYFNQIYFGHGAYGVEAASRFYFDKSTRDLNFAESTLLAILPNAPNYFSPVRNPKIAQKMHYRLIMKMVKLGYISEEDAKREYYDFWLKYLNQNRSQKKSSWNVRIDRASYFTEYIRRKMDKKLGKNQLYGEGFRIYTTLDLNLQRAAQSVLWKSLRRINKKNYKKRSSIKTEFYKKVYDSVDLLSLLFSLNNMDIGGRKTLERFKTEFDNSKDSLDLLSLMMNLDSAENLLYILKNRGKENVSKVKKVEGAIVSLEPGTGDIRAMVGGSGFNANNQINRVVQMKRQAGSGFKPFVYASALDSGEFTAATVMVDEPIVYFDKDGNKWIPNNYGGHYHGRVTVRKALQKSINIISVKLADTIGLDPILNLASKMLHIYSPEEKRKRLRHDLSIALGTIEVSPLEMATAYGILANSGRDVVPQTLRRIEDRYGNVVENIEAKHTGFRGKAILTPQIAYIMISLMKGILQPGGTAWRAVGYSAYPYASISAGKTGTTDNWKDAWFTGVTPALSTSVWVGFDDYSMSLGRGNTGGAVAAPIWTEFMKYAMQYYDHDDFIEPNGLVKKVICQESGLLATPSCTKTNLELFVKGSEPTKFCDYSGKQKTDEADYEVQELNPSLLKKRKARYQLLDKKLK